MHRICDILSCGGVCVTCQEFGKIADLPKGPIALVAPQ